MAKANKTKTAAAEAAQEAREGLGMSQDTQGQETPPAAAEGVQDPYQDLMEPDPVPEPEPAGEALIEPAAFADYVVTGCNWLRLRQEPSLDSEVVTKLPRGVGVVGLNRPAENGWRQVFTGWLHGWVMDKYLEPLGSAGDVGG